ncbi:MAG TPA: hypothetical protein VIL74_11475 [Pyrinomonadaceae bacterium]|jgi:hypothetical protein
MRKFTFAVFFSTLIFVFALSPAAQTRNPVKKNERPTAIVPTPEPSPTPAPTTESQPINKQVKKNERPANGNAPNAGNSRTGGAPNYFYEFSQPNFVVSKINIEHDETGKGTISFVKNISDEVITDPIQLTPAAMERINAVLTTLDFMNSTENYQYEKDYSHLGNVAIKINKDGRARETKFNWTTNPNAKALADEYRKIANQYIWMFDVNLARTNQPLEAPKLMDLLDSYIKRNEVSDAAQLVPFLKELGDDERIPLIARNHATRLAKELEKAKK